MKLYGSHYILTVLPIWLTALVLYVVTLGAIFVLRDRFEGLFYNTSYSAMLGDGALMVAVLMAAEILKREGGPPDFGSHGFYHANALLAGILVGFIWWMVDRPEQWADVYHHFHVRIILKIKF